MEKANRDMPTLEEIRRALPELVRLNSSIIHKLQMIMRDRNPKTVTDSDDPIEQLSALYFHGTEKVQEDLNRSLKIYMENHVKDIRTILLAPEKIIIDWEGDLFPIDTDPKQCVVKVFGENTKLENNMAGEGGSFHRIESDILRYWLREPLLPFIKTGTYKLVRMNPKKFADHKVFLDKKGFSAAGLLELCAFIEQIAWREKKNGMEAHAVEDQFYKVKIAELGDEVAERVGVAHVGRITGQRTGYLGKLLRTKHTSELGLESVLVRKK